MAVKPSIAWAVTTDGRKEFIEAAMPTWHDLTGNVIARIIVDDSGDPAYREWLRATYGGADIVHVGGDRMGYNAAMKRMREVGLATGADYIFHLEDDFKLMRPLDLDDLTSVMEANPMLAQMALVRGPWYHNEVAHGGMIQALKAQGCAFTECGWGGTYWIEHRAVWTANPSVFPKKIAMRHYPDGDWSESAFMRDIRETTRFKCAYWGRMTDEPMVDHIGTYKMGTGY